MLSRAANLYHKGREYFSAIVNRIGNTHMAVKSTVSNIEIRFIMFYRGPPRAAGFSDDPFMAAAAVM